MLEHFDCESFVRLAADYVSFPSEEEAGILGEGAPVEVNGAAYERVRALFAWRVPPPPHVDVDTVVYGEVIDTAENIYLEELYAVQIPAITAAIERALLGLDSVRDAALIAELQDLRHDLSDLERQIWYKASGQATYWESKTSGGPITPESAYRKVVNELRASEMSIFGTRGLNIVA